jgi:formylglycine-generating enzyme required for sulfatase activity
MANTWQGSFPWQNLCSDGYEGTSPVGSFAANGYGLVDMIENVREWSCDYVTPRHQAALTARCAPRNPRANSPEALTAGAGSYPPRKVIKGGSHRCAPNYCLRYRPAARQGEAIDTASCHLGFRCVVPDSKDRRP